MKLAPLASDPTECVSAIINGITALCDAIIRNAELCESDEYDDCDEPTKVERPNNGGDK